MEYKLSKLISKKVNASSGETLAPFSAGLS